MKKIKSIKNTLISGYIATHAKAKLIVKNDMLIGIDNGIFEKKENITSLNIPTGITQIGIMAFYGCTALENMKLPDSITSIELGAFLECSSLKKIKLSSDLTLIEKQAFKNCTSLSIIEIP